MLCLCYKPGSRFRQTGLLLLVCAKLPKQRSCCWRPDGLLPVLAGADWECVSRGPAACALHARFRERVLLPPSAQFAKRCFAPRHGLMRGHGLTATQRRMLVRRRVRLPLPISTALCGDAVHDCGQPAGHVAGTHQCPGVDAADRRQLALVVHGSTASGVVLCCDVTLVSPLNREGRAQPAPCSTRREVGRSSSRHCPQCENRWDLLATGSTTKRRLPLQPFRLRLVADCQRAMASVVAGSF